MQESDYDYEQTPINEIVNKGYVTKTFGQFTKF